MHPLKTLKFLLNHPFNRRRQLNALARYLDWQVRSRLNKEVQVEWINGVQLIAENGMTGITGNIYCGLHEYEDMSLVIHALRPGDLFVDVGANVGSYSLLASGVCHARSIAIEPDQVAVNCLLRNIFVNDLQDLVRIEPTAVGEETGTVSFTKGRDTMNRVASESDALVQVVPLARLDDVLGDLEPTLMKFDVEGYEVQALNGALRALGRPTLIALLLETVDKCSLSLLHDYGFKQFSYDPIRRSLAFPHQGYEGANVLFVRDVDALEARLQTAIHRTYLGRTI